MDESGLFFCAGLMWTPPEVLRDLSKNEWDKENIAEMRGLDYPTPQGDIYAFGIVLKEVFSRNGPYTEYDDLSSKGEAGVSVVISQVPQGKDVVMVAQNIASEMRAVSVASTKGLKLLVAGSVEVWEGRGRRYKPPNKSSNSELS